MKKEFLMPLICLVFCYGTISHAVNPENEKALNETMSAGSNDARNKELTPNRGWPFGKAKKKTYSIAYGERRSQFKLDRIIGTVGKVGGKVLVTQSKYQYHKEPKDGIMVSMMAPLKEDGSVYDKGIDLRISEEGKYVNHSEPSKITNKAILTSKTFNVDITQNVDARNEWKKILKDLNRKTLDQKMNDKKALKKSNLKIEEVVPGNMETKYMDGHLQITERIDGWINSNGEGFYENPETRNIQQHFVGVINQRFVPSVKYTLIE